MAKVAIVTGANTGIGKEIARSLAANGTRVVMACRNRERAEAARKELIEATGNEEISLMLVDLGRLESIRSFAAEVQERFEGLDILVNNAGVAHEKLRFTEDGFELIFGVNFLGPFLLTNLLLDGLKRAAPARIVNVASSVHRNGHIDRSDPQMREVWVGRRAYANSKLADILFTRELARRLDGSGVTVNCYNPGLVRSEFFRNYDPVPFMLRVVLVLMGKSPQRGAEPGVALALSDSLAGVTGAYYENGRVREPSEEARDEDLAQWLWDYAAGQVGLDARS